MMLDQTSSLVSSLFNDGGLVLLGGGVRLAMAIGPAQFDDPIEAYLSRVEANVVQAEVKANVLSASSVRIVVDQAADKNAGQVAHGWPTGVKHVLIVITTDNGKTEVYRGITSRLHNKIDIPEGFAGKMFLVKAAFLKHTNDKPEFLAETTFTMPFTFDDLTKMIEQQHEADLEEHRLEVERLVEENRLLREGKK
jgi:hypothetical protein